jgi:hypothetical protein
MTQRTWRNQFQDYPVPTEIDGLVTAGFLNDTSWGNDICPTFEMYRHGKGIRIWVDHPDQRLREMKTPRRFTVTPLVLEGSKGVWVMPDPTPTLLATDSVAEVLSLVETFDRQPLVEAGQ